MKPISKKQVGHFPSHPGEGIFNDKQMPKAACATVLISRGICKAPLLAELCPGDCEGESGREPDRAVSLLFVWGVLLSSPLLPSPFGNVVCKHWALRMLPQLMRFEGRT